MAERQTPTKPIPEPDEASRPFFEGALAGRLMLMRCRSCGTPRMPARLHCDACLSTESEWFEASGRGLIYTFGIMHQRYHPAFAAEIPYNLGVVELEEGPRLVTNFVGVSNANLRVGLPVVVEWERHSGLADDAPGGGADTVALPKFRPA
jgi:uncharacterized OB-fold protein